MKLPNFLVIGPPRTGTTWLFRNVSRHPQIYVPEEKQIHFFDQHYDNGLEWYGDIFKDAPESATAIGDITPNYYASPEAPKRILDTFGSTIRLFVIFRDPVERAYSEYRMKARSSGATESFLEALDRDKYLRINSLYAENFKRFQQHFEDDSLHVLSYQQLSQDPTAFLRNFLATLNVDTEYALEGLAEPVGSSQAPAKWHRLNSAAVGVKNRLESFPIGRRFMWTIRERGLVKIWHGISSKDHDGNLTEEERSKAMSYFEADLEEFSAIRSRLGHATHTMPTC